MPVTLGAWLQLSCEHEPMLLVFVSGTSVPVEYVTMSATPRLTTPPHAPFV